VLVTGAAGFIGRNLVRALRACGAEVVGVDDWSSPYAVAGPWIERGDVLDLGIRDVHGIDTLVHLAARKNVAASFADRDEIARNVLVDRHLVELAARGAIRRLLVASSCEVYGDRGALPANAEVDAFAPRSPYAVSKVALEHLLSVYARPGQESTALRFFNVYGPDEGPDAVVPRFIAEVRTRRTLTIEGDGRQRRDFNDVEDVVDMLVQLVGHPGPLPCALNVGSGRSRSIRELAAVVLDLAAGGGVAHEASRPNEVDDFTACTTRLGAFVTLRRRSLEAGVARCWAQQPCTAFDARTG
jgi:dTDP-glucose 4,6-dehydratase/UDP-glucose 4-epimerase